jgi:hypothetical protein
MFHHEFSKSMSHHPACKRCLSCSTPCAGYQRDDSHHWWEAAWRAKMACRQAIFWPPFSLDRKEGGTHNQYTVVGYDTTNDVENTQPEPSAIGTADAASEPRRKRPSLFGFCCLNCSQRERHEQLLRRISVYTPQSHTKVSPKMLAF